MTELIDTGYNGFGLEEIFNPYEALEDISAALYDFVIDIERILSQENYVLEGTFDARDIMQAWNESNSPSVQSVVDFLTDLATEDGQIDFDRINAEDSI